MIDLGQPEVKNLCKGTIWRYKKNKFINKKGELVWTDRVSYLKSKSCEGSCDYPRDNVCASFWLIDEVSEYLACADLLPELPEDAYSGCLLKLYYSCPDPEWGIEELYFKVVKEDV